jgi:hypothetical protein
LSVFFDNWLGESDCVGIFIVRHMLSQYHILVEVARENEATRKAKFSNVAVDEVFAYGTI